MLLGIYSVYLIIFTVVAYFFLLPFILNYNSFYLFNWKVQFYILKNASDRMRKTPIKIHPLQEKIQAFQRSPVFQCKKELKIDQNKLKKIGRNRLIFKQPSLPVLNTIKNKENIQNFGQQHLAQVKKQANIKENAKNLSFSKARQFNLQQALSRMIVSQKDLNHLNQSQKLKQLALKKQFFIRNRKMLPQRNCISAISPPLDRDKIDNLPQGIKDMRKVMRKKKSREVRQQQIKQLPISEQAKRMAEQARPSSAPNASKHPVRSASLQDFLNQWKIRCLD